MSEDEIRSFIKLVFEKYQKIKNKNNVYNVEGNIPQNIIKLYHIYIHTTSFENIIKKFKKRYIFNETLLEEASDKERLGLGEMYDYIKEYDCSKKFNLYILLKLHQLIFSKCDFPEFGGTFRNDSCYLPGSGVVIPEYDHVPFLMADLYKEVEVFLAETEASIKDETFDVIKYINKCIDIKCKIVEIHPFPNGNGRSARGFLNLLFKKVGLPPTYVESHEKKAYSKAMNQAIVDNDYRNIYRFYYQKLCDSIYELDIKAPDQIEQPVLDGNKSM